MNTIKLTREESLEIILKSISLSKTYYSLEGIFNKHSDILQLEDYAFDILVYSVQKEKFEIANYVINTIGSISKIGINKNNYKTLVFNEKGLKFLELELIKDKISNF